MDTNIYMVLLCTKAHCLIGTWLRKVNKAIIHVLSKTREEFEASKRQSKKVVLKRTNLLRTHQHIPFQECSLNQIKQPLSYLILSSLKIIHTNTHIIFKVYKMILWFKWNYLQQH